MYDRFFKKLLLFFLLILFLFILFYSSSVFSYSGSEYIKYYETDFGKTIDSNQFHNVAYVSGDSPSLFYKLFNSTGFHEGSVLLPEGASEWKSFVALNTDIKFGSVNKNYIVIVYTTVECPKFGMLISQDTSIGYIISPPGSVRYKVSLCLYDVEAEIWSCVLSPSESLPSEFSNYGITFSSDRGFLKIDRNATSNVYRKNSVSDILYTYNTTMDVYCAHCDSRYMYPVDESNHFHTGWGNCIYFPDELVTPSLSIVDNSKLRVNLGDFHGDYFVVGNPEVDSVLSELKISVTDKNNKNISYIDGVDLLSYSDVQRSGTNYYLDVSLNDLYPLLTNMKGDYEVGLYTLMRYDEVMGIYRDVETCGHSIYFPISFPVFQKCFLKVDPSSSTVLLYTEGGGSTDPDNPDPDTPDNPVNPNQGVEDKLNGVQNAIDKQTEAIQEQTETQKSIWQTLLDLPKTLIDMLLNLFKSIFIPSDDFLSNYFDELFNWFCDRLGFLSYPVELFVDILTKIMNLNFGEPIISIPDIEEPFTGELLVKATSFNLNSLLTNNTLKSVHEIYLIFVDAIIIFALVNLAKNKFEEVTKS